METETEGHLPFLDIDIYRRPDGSLGHRVYRKSTHTNLYLNAAFHHHPSNKQAALSTLVHRARALCYVEECVSRTRAFEWCKCFREGRERVKNESHDRRPRTSVTEPNIDRADALIRENRSTTIKELGAMLSISVGSVEDIMKYHLHYRKVNARWVQRTLTDVNKMVRMQAASCLLQQFEDEGEAFLKSIVTTVETLVHYFIPESQQSSREWRHTSSPKPESAEEPFGRKSDGNVLLGLTGGYPCRLSDRYQNSQCSLLLRHPGNRREVKDPIQAEERWKAGSLP
ncbi:hypothetical protein B7P43_G07226 [Cryptotermes secundus]|uniref:Mos1 transposase HTH domain-containing protein n=1 Tax=Cryptotermes secundus TaxID=105785 RepID=A0A2J7QZ53_9NEOP|nr:hypothetical protein B7P43_G07226 [Cryptotermes secundus]